MEKTVFWKRLLYSALGAGLAGLAGYLFLGHAAISDVYYGKSPGFLNRMFEHRGEHSLLFYLQKADYLLILVLSGWVTALLALQRLVRTPSGWEKEVLDALVFFLYAGLFYFHFVNFNVEREWYLLSDAMAFATQPPFHHRVMLIMPALLLRAVFPALTHSQSFFIAQAAAIVLTLWAVKRFAGLFVDKNFSFIAQFLTLALWAPTVCYFTFYDVGILFVYSFCLYHLMRGEYRPYLLMFALGTYNHELSLFLVAASTFVCFGRMETKRLIIFLLAQLVVYALVRSSLFYFLPTDRAWARIRMDRNIDLFMNQRGRLLTAYLSWILWSVPVALGARHAPSALRRCLVVLPCLLVMTFVVGQFNELRQFDAFIPIAVALIVCWIARLIGAQPPRAL